MFAFVLEWAGTALIIAAYILNQFGILGSDSLWYMLFNFFGALFLGILFFRKKVWGPVILQIIWAGVAILAIFQYFFFYG